MKDSMKIKREMLEQLKQELMSDEEKSLGIGDEMGRKRKAKVVIASDSKEGLKEGLDKAKEVLAAAPMEEEEDMHDEDCECQDCKESMKKEE